MRWANAVLFEEARTRQTIGFNFIANAAGIDFGVALR